MKRSLGTDHRGFTIPELLVAITLLIAACVGSYYLEKPRNFDVPTRDAARRTAVAHIVQGVTKYYAAHGELPANITTDKKIIGNDKDSADICAALVPAYLKDIPFDPKWGAETVKGACTAPKQQYLTAYLISKSADGKSVTVSAPLHEGPTAISITRTF